MPLPPLDWSRDSAGWPHRAHSRLIEAGGAAGRLRWHVQVMGQGPAVLLLHGTGAANHSWRHLAPLLVAAGYQTVAPDLPGQGFSTALPAGRCHLNGMAQAVADLLDALAVRPAVAVGHSAGAALLARMGLMGRITPQVIVGINAALLPFEGPLQSWFSPLAKLMAAQAWLPGLLARQVGHPSAVRSLLARTGSRLDAEGEALYARLVRHPGHIASTLDMMAHWDLQTLRADLPRLRIPLHLIVGLGDTTVPPAQAERMRPWLTNCQITHLAALGHLAHEENAAQVLAAMALPAPVGTQESARGQPLPSAHG